MTETFRLYHGENGYAIFAYHPDALEYIQITPWYKRLANLKRFHKLARCFRVGLRYLQETGADIEHDKVERALQSASDFCKGNDKG